MTPFILRRLFLLERYENNFKVSIIVAPPCIYNSVYIISNFASGIEEGLTTGLFLVDEEVINELKQPAAICSC